ncbi:hypothetical protein V5N11_018925 [Cardamine amara subsp. amara]|uniref:HpcH/HpaI aldolase/citrate lyase domain-containing protein n=1 Tax=Cardamine amara subsp. amara TaxID=228776 RepID=A0ABD1BZV5_CARAN
MCQIESEEGVKNVDEIVALDGMDCVMMGPRDLSASLGLLQDPGNPKLKSVMSMAETAVLASDPAKGGAYLAGMATAQDKAVDLKARGYPWCSDQPTCLCSRKQQCLKRLKLLSLVRLD